MFARVARYEVDPDRTQEAIDAFLAVHTPYHDRLGELHAVLESWQLRGVALHDTRVPARYGGAADDFNDAAHIGYASSDALLRFVLALAPAPTVQVATRSAD